MYILIFLKASFYELDLKFYFEIKIPIIILSANIYLSKNFQKNGPS